MLSLGVFFVLFGLFAYAVCKALWVDRYAVISYIIMFRHVSPGIHLSRKKAGEPAEGWAILLALSNGGLCLMRKC